MTKQFEFENLKIPQNGQIPGLVFFNLQIQNFFVIFGFPSKNIFFRANILLSYQKNC